MIHNQKLVVMLEYDTECDLVKINRDINIIIDCLLSIDLRAHIKQ